MNVDSRIVQVLFVNPDVPSNKWTHGITFRQSAEEAFHAVFISSDGSWGHFARGGSTNNEVVSELGQANFDTTPGGRNLLTLSFKGLGGVLFINDIQVADLDLSFPPALGPGEVRVMSGMFPTDELTGESTIFAGFTVYK